MAISFVAFNEYKRQALQGNVDLENDTIKVAQLMTNTTVDTENDGVQYLDEFTTLDRYDGSGYSDETLANGTVSKNDTDDRGECEFDDISIPSLGAGTRDINVVLVYKYGSGDSDSIPLWAYVFTAGDQTNGNGGTLTIEWPSDHLIRLQQA